MGACLSLFTLLDTEKTGFLGAPGTLCPSHGSTYHLHPDPGRFPAYQLWMRHLYTASRCLAGHGQLKKSNNIRPVSPVGLHSLLPLAAPWGTWCYREDRRCNEKVESTRSPSWCCWQGGGTGHRKPMGSPHQGR